MDKCVIFGAGWWGRLSFVKLNSTYEVIAYVDNNAMLWGTEVKGVPVISPSALQDLGASIFVCVKEWRDIAQQLDDLGLEYVIMDNYLSYRLNDHKIYPLHLAKPKPYKKVKADEFAVLFVQYEVCARTNKIAHVLRNNGVKTTVAYLSLPSTLEGAFDEQLPIFSFANLSEYVNDSDFDVVHSSNSKKDILTNILVHSNKKTIFDCHDINSESYTYLTLDDFMMEFVAITQSAGVMTFSEQSKSVIRDKYKIEGDKCFVLANYPLSSFKPSCKIPKLSERDGGLHCVYEGSIIADTETLAPKYYLGPYFRKIAESGIHVHFYSNSNESGCKALANLHTFIHFEGNISGIELITAMTQYDVGICAFNLADGVTRSYLEMASPNKQFEYLAAGLPIITNVRTYADFAERNRCGCFFDIDGDIKAQVREAMKFNVGDDFLEENQMTMDSNAVGILDFYRRIINS